jgi:two-component system response regulator HydG
MPNILIVDDDRYTTRLLADLLRGKADAVAVAHDGAQARMLFAEEDFNLILMDQRLPGDNGLDILQEMRAQRPQQMAILMSGYADVRDALRAVRDGVFDYLTKPFPDLEELEAVIDRALELDRAYREISDLRLSLGAGQTTTAIIGRSPVMARLHQQVGQVAPLDTTILIEGESGTGKTMLARAIHAASGRNRGPFLEINCGAVPEQLLESTLFGFERGAFTGAERTTAGYFEMADGGTLFLDEITDMSPKLQSSLLHLLQEHAFCRIGSTQRRTSDFRLVCATNRPLLDRVRAGAFREDLFYRINVVRLQAPPLRSREDDIVLLATHFLQHFNSKFGKAVGPFTPDALGRLVACPFPGNVRQLEHAIERVVALRPGGPVRAEDLDDLACAEASGPGLAPTAGVQSYHQERQNFEQQYLARLMKASGGNVTEASRMSGIPRQSLYVRMKRWGYVTDS